MKKPYTGILAEPNSGPLSPLDLMERLVALAKHYDVEPLGPNALMLAFKLATDHVPGFQIKPSMPSGRKPDVVKDCVILVALFRAEEEGQSVSKAARHLAVKHSDWGIEAETIRQRYYSMKSAQKSPAGRRRLLRVVKLLRLLN